MAPVGPSDEEVERIAQLMDDLARPIFVLRGARGLLRTNAKSSTREAASQNQGARKRERNAAAQIIALIDKYVREK